jgi:hypothetical protein
MATGTGRGGRGRSGGDQGGGGRGRSGGGGNWDDDGRFKVAVGWVNGKADEAAVNQYLPDMLADGIYLRVSFEDGFDGQIPEGFKVFGFPNKNKKGRAPDFDFIALPPQDD